MKLLTVIIPVYNRADRIVPVLDSIVAQTLRPFRLILVDNASTDGSRSVMEKWIAGVHDKELQIDLIDEAVPGASAARNAGLALVDTPWTLFFDSDDFMAPDHLAQVVATALEHPDADIIGWDSTVIFESTGRKKIKHFFTSDPLYYCIMEGSLSTQCYMARTDIFRRAGGWNPDVPVWNDVELSARLLRLSPKIVKAATEPSNVLIYNHHDSITGSGFSPKAEERNHSLRSVLSACSDVNSSRLQSIVALKRAILAGCCLREGAKDKAQDILDEALVAPISSLQRIAVRLAYCYTAHGGRGAARILKFLF